MSSIEFNQASKPCSYVTMAQGIPFWRQLPQRNKFLPPKNWHILDLTTGEINLRESYSKKFHRYFGLTLEEVGSILNVTLKNPEVVNPAGGGGRY